MDEWWIRQRASEKRCNDCGETKPVDAYYKKSSGAPLAYCKPCYGKRSIASYWRRKGIERN